jgi:hypothetical protein
MTDNARLDMAIGQIEFARRYMLQLVAELPEDDWFSTPDGATTHVAWQIGHLAVAEYGLCLFRMRGRQEGDAELLPSSFRKQFSKGSQPSGDRARYPAPREIREILDQVHAQAMRELPGYSAADLDQPAEEPYAMFPTRLGALIFCSMHEMMHAGQIGLLRRSMGKSPIR